MIPGTPTQASGRSEPPGAVHIDSGMLTHPARPVWQFRTSSLLWLTFTAAMTLAFARLFGPWATILAMLTPAVAAVIGAGVGAMKGRVVDGAYWATIGATLGTVCIIAAPQPHWWMVLWSLLGAVVGGAAAVFQLRITIVELITAGVISAILWGLATTPPGVPIAEFTLDLALAPLIAVGFAFLVTLVDRLQATYRTSRDAWAAGLVFAVIAGNLWAAFVAGRLG